MTSHDDYFLGNFETGEIWSKDGFYKFKFDGYIVSNFMGLLSLLNCLHLHYEENKQLKQQLDDSIEMQNKQINSAENAFEELLKEKEQLKKEINILRGALGINESYDYDRLLKENEHLENENLELKEDNKKLKEKIKELKR